MRHRTLIISLAALNACALIAAAGDAQPNYPAARPTI
jgi:hypothetical protein